MPDPTPAPTRSQPTPGRDSAPAPPAPRTSSRGRVPKILTVNEDDVAAIFSEWDRCYRAAPDFFWSAVRHLCDETPDLYGRVCAWYFMQIAEPIVRRRENDVEVPNQIVAGVMEILDEWGIGPRHERDGANVGEAVLEIRRFILEQNLRGA